MIDYSKLVTKEMKDAKALQDAQEKENREARAFLAATDYKVIKELERIFQDQIDPSALAGRQDARNRVIDNEVA